jgi:hypothetical protein
MVKEGDDNKKDAAELATTPSKTAALFAKRSLPGSKTYADRAEECRLLAHIYPYWKAGYFRLAATYEFLSQQSERSTAM